jgi:low affinity Fe/Cu permease
MYFIYRRMERIFEKMAYSSSRWFSSSITFLVVNILIAVWMADRDWETETFSSFFGDLIAAVTFVIFFLLQRSFSHFEHVLHLKLNELVAAHENARNFLIKAEERTEEELKELEKEHIALVAKYMQMKRDIHDPSQGRPAPQL